MTNKFMNTRIAKNTGMLYIRMLVIMLVSLYTSRIVLKIVGIQDFGIYNVVAGFVTMLGFINSSMVSATQRFLAFELGRNNLNQLSRVFNMSLNIHIIIAIIFFIIAETVGVWFINNELVIPIERIRAANFVFQFSILSFVFSIINVPYNALIISYERMGIYAWVSVMEVVLKLIIVYLLKLSNFDKLILYSFFLLCITILLRIINGIYCAYNFKASKFVFLWDFTLFRILISYAGWNLWGQLSSVLKGQGVNVVLNIFFGPSVNAARGIAYQIQGAIYSFVTNFQVALNPQIIKNFAKGDIKIMHQLVFRGSKYSFFLLYVLALPVLLQTEKFIKLWLSVVPEYVVIFTQLVLINILVECLSGSLITAAQATGKIKVYQGVVGGLYILTLPLSYFLLKAGLPPETTLVLSIFISIVALFVRLVMLKKLINLSFKKFLSEVINKVLLISTVSLIIVLPLYFLLSNEYFGIFIITILSFIISLSSIYFLGLSSSEKKFIKDFVISQLMRNRT